MMPRELPVEPPEVPAPPAPAAVRYIPYVTLTIAALNVLAFAVSIALGASPLLPSPDKMFELGGNFGPATLDGEPWRMVTSMFLHYGLLHIAFNMFALLDGGRHVEAMYGRAGFAALYLFSGLVGGLASAIPGQAVSAGASGAIFGVFGAFGAFLVRHRGRLDKEQVRKQSRGLVIFLVYNVFIGLSTKGIDMRAHIGGLAAGFAAGMLLASERRRIASALVVGVLGSALVFGAALVMPAPTATVLLPASKAALDRFAALEQQALTRFNKLVSDNASNAEFARVIEAEILPIWREAKAELADVRGLRAKVDQAMRAYADARERAFVDIATAARGNDQAALTRAAAEMREADALVAHIND
ncbi:MAG: rhomboid family intramembrane serine protease [Deltaproteobacteria bacterium]|nr:rhomboid family intramembrane serine protease [Deltaproteobacteria bacterium]